MREYTIVFSRSARRELDKLPDSVVDRILPRIEELSTSPRPHGCRKIKGSDNLWRIRVGDYRVIYSVDDRLRLVDIVAVRHRSEAYQ